MAKGEVGSASMAWSGQGCGVVKGGRRKTWPNACMIGLDCLVAKPWPPFCFAKGWSAIV